MSATGALRQLDAEQSNFRVASHLQVDWIACEMAFIAVQLVLGAFRRNDSTTSPTTRGRRYTLRYPRTSVCQLQRFAAADPYDRRRGR